MGPDVEARLSVDNDGLAGIKACYGNDKIFVGLESLDRPLLDCLAGLYAPNVKAMGAGLHRDRRYGDCVLACGDEHAHAYKFAGPQPAVVVCKLRLKLNCTGGLID